MPRLFFSKHAEIAIVGLQVCSLCIDILGYMQILFTQASGKTSFVNVLGSGQVSPSYRSACTSHLVPVLNAQQWSEDVVPTVAFNLRVVKKGNVSLKIWDVAGTPSQ